MAQTVPEHGEGREDSDPHPLARRDASDPYPTSPRGETAQEPAVRRDEVRAFFAERAATWDSRFPDDGPAYTAGVAALRLRAGDRVLDAGCGTGRALPALREAVGPAGTVVGLDLTPQMLDAAVDAGRGPSAGLVVGDVCALPLTGACLDAVFAAGLVTHLPGVRDGLRELARVVRPGGRLALFHPLGRTALAARKGYALTSRDPRARPRLEVSLEESGWRMESYVDEDRRFLVLALREG